MTTIASIKAAVASHYGVRLTDLEGACQARWAARPRQVAMYFCRTLTCWSYPNIASRFGGRDHTTVMHAVRNIGKLAVSDPTIAADVAILASQLRPAIIHIGVHAGDNSLQPSGDAPETGA